MCDGSGRGRNELEGHMRFSFHRNGPEEVRQPCAFHVINRAPLRHSFYVSRPCSHINLFIQGDFNYKKGARMSYLLRLEMAIIFLEIVKTVAGLDTLRCRRRDGCHCGCLPSHMGKNTSLFGMLDQNETRFFTYVSQHAESKAATVVMSN